MYWSQVFIPTARYLPISCSIFSTVSFILPCVAQAKVRFIVEGLRPDGREEWMRAGESIRPACSEQNPPAVTGARCALPHAEISQCASQHTSVFWCSSHEVVHILNWFTVLSLAQEARNARVVNFACGFNRHPLARARPPPYSRTRRTQRYRLRPKCCLGQVSANSAGSGRSSA